MAKVNFERRLTNEEVDDISIEDGNFIVTGDGKLYIDYGSERVSIGGTPDSNVSDTSTNSIQNKAIKKYIDDSFKNQIETFLIALQNKYSFVENMQNQCYYNKNTKQVTLIYYINGPIPYDTWTTIGTIPEKYRPPKTIYIESTAGVVRAVIQISNNGIVQAWIPRVANSNPLNNVRGTGVYYTF